MPVPKKNELYQDENWTDERKAQKCEDIEYLYKPENTIARLELSYKLWRDQDNLFWRTIYSVPIIAIAVFAGWHTLYFNNKAILSLFVIIAGLVVMFLQHLIIKRMAQLVSWYEPSVQPILPTHENLEKECFGLNGKKIILLLSGFILFCTVFIFIFTLITVLCNTCTAV